ncbi:MAG: hypothetical protein ACREVV_01365 [Steroidobacteraceae bacterium]
MATRLDKTLKREIIIRGRPFIIAISPDGLKVTVKGRRKGQELRWTDLVSGDAALAIALNASMGQFTGAEEPTKAESAKPSRARSRPGRKQGKR